MITLKNISDKQTFHIPRSVVEAEFVSGYETKDVSITSNGTYEIRPSKGKKALSAVSLDVDIQIDPTPYYDEGFKDGIADQKAKLESIDITANGTYNCEDGYNNVVVNIDTEPFYNEGYETGVADQKAQLTSIDITSNGTYENPDGYKTVNVDVEVGIIPNFQDKEVLITDNGEYSITPDDGFDGLDEVKVTVNCAASGGTFVVPKEMKFAYSDISEFPESWDWSDYENATDLARLFQTCVFLTKVPKLTISPTSTAQMYYGCSQIKEVDLSGWNTSNTTDMSETFYSCRGLTEIDVTNLDTSNCSEMYGLFAGCHELKKIIGIEQLDTSKNINFTNMFSNCQKLTKLPEIDCSSNTTQTSSSNSPINNCYVLRDFGGLKGFNKRLYCNSAYSLSYESLLNIINGLADGVSGQTLYLHQDCVNQLSDDDIAAATNKGWSISPAKKITSPTTVYILSQIPVATYNITPKTYDFSQFDGVWGTSSGSSITNKSYMYVFEGDLSNTTDASYMFKNCSKLSYVTLTNTQNIVNMKGMFWGTPITTAPELDTSSVIDMSNMFYDTDITNIPNYNTSNVTNMTYMFYECLNLKTADLSGWDLSKVEDISNMFGGCRNLTSIKMTGDVSNITNAYNFVWSNQSGIFYYNPEYDYSKLIKELPSTWTAVPLK